MTLWYRAPELLLGAKEYSLPVDVWSIGTMFVDMVNKRTPWPGDSQIDQIFRIFLTLGTPTEERWPGVTGLRDFKPLFPNWPRRSLAARVPRLDDVGIDLLTQMLCYDPVKRMTCRAALKHPWFDDLRS